MYAGPRFIVEIVAPTILEVSSTSPLGLSELSPPPVIESRQMAYEHRGAATGPHVNFQDSSSRMQPRHVLNTMPCHAMPCHVVPFLFRQRNPRNSTLSLGLVDAVDESVIDVEYHMIMRPRYIMQGRRQNHWQGIAESGMGTRSIGGRGTRYI